METNLSLGQKDEQDSKNEREQSECVLNLVEQAEFYLYKEKDWKRAEEAIKKILVKEPENDSAIKGLKFIRDIWIQDMQKAKVGRAERRQSMENSAKREGLNGNKEIEEILDSQAESRTGADSTGTEDNSIKMDSRKEEEEQRFENKDAKEQELCRMESEVEYYLKTENSLNRAEGILKEILDKAPGRSFALRLCSIIYRIKAQDSQDGSQRDNYLVLAQGSIEKSLELYPADPWSYEELARVHSVRRDKVKAQEAINKAIELLPEEYKFKELANEIEEVFKFEETQETQEKFLTSRPYREAAEDISDSKKRDIHFAWDIHYRCNFRCPYCWFYTVWSEVGRRNIHLLPEQWMEHWQRIYNKYGSVRIEITGGEPFLYPNFIPLVKLLSTLHIVKVTTNMTGDIQAWIKEIDPERVNMDMNFHPLFSEVDSFIKKALILKDTGFNAGVCYLAYPPQMGTMEYYKKKFDEAGINFALAAYWGKYDGRDYPAAYTEEEREIIRPFLGDIDRITYHLNAESPRGKLCRAGYKYADIQADGKVVRCAQYADKPFGNIMEPDFSLFTESMPCEVDFCPGNEYDNIC